MVFGSPYDTSARGGSFGPGVIAVQDRPSIITVTPPEKRLELHYRPKLLRQSGGGGWVERQHDRAKASTEWVGTPLHTVTLSLFFDAIRSDRLVDVEAELAMLHSFSLPTSSTGEPPVLRLNFGHGQQLHWVASAPIYQTTELRDNRRVQALVDLDLLEYRAAVLGFSPVEAVEKAAAEKVNPDINVAVAPNDARTVTVKSGDTLSGIAARELGSAGRFNEIYELNQPPLTSPDILPVGVVLKLPAV